MIRSLAIKKVAGRVKKEGWKWVDVLLDVIGEYDRFHAPEPEPTPEEAEKLEALNGRCPTSARTKMSGRAGAAAPGDHRRHRGAGGFTRGQMKASGVLLTLSYNGRIDRHQGLIRPRGR